MGPWLPAAIGFCALLIQAFMGFFFLGKMRAEVTSMDSKVEKFQDQVDRLERLANQMTSAADVAESRIGRLEADASSIDKLVRDLSAFKGGQDVHNANTAKGLESMNRELGGVQRQLANLVVMKRAGSSFEQGPLND